MDLRRILFGAILGPGLVMVGGLEAQAGQILTYTGNPFTSALAPYTVNDRVTATIELASPLGNSVTNVTASPVAFTFSDGLQTLTEANATISSFLFSTNAMGEIIGWELQVDATATDGYIQTCGATSCGGFPGLTFDFGISVGTVTTLTSARCPSSVATQSGGPGAGNVCVPGTWAARETTAVPAPASAALLMAAFGLLVPLARRNAGIRLG